MRARLTVTSDQRQNLGLDASRDFQQAGGIIGRAATCDWRLPDPTHTVSARHAEIRHNGHGFVVVDLSTNGVYVNTTDAPLGRGNSAVLVSGDTLYLGAYVIGVEILRDVAPVGRPGVDAGSRPAASPPPPAAPDLVWPASPARAPSAYRAPAPPRPVDPLGALDGADSPQEGDNPFFELGLVRKSGETTTGWRDLLESRSRPAPAAPPQPPQPQQQAPVAPPAYGAPAARPAGLGAPGPLIPQDFALPPLPTGAPLPPPSAAPVAAPIAAPVSPPPVQSLAPPIPAPAFAPPAPGLSLEGGIPPGFLDELSELIPRLSPAPPPPEPPLTIARGVSSRAPADGGAAAPDPVSLLRQRAAARSGSAGSEPAAPHMRPLALGDTPPAQEPAPAPWPLPPGASAASVPRSHDPAEPIWALLGLDGASLPPEVQARLFADIAGLLREMADGLVSVLEARRLIKDGFNLDQTQLRPVENNPFKFCTSGREALDKSLVKRPPGFLAPAEAARAGFADVKVHEMAAMEAMQATIARLLQRVSPAAVTFEVEGEAPGSAGLFARKLDKGRLWDRYLAMHERLVDALDVISPEVVGEEFARAYAHNTQDLRRRDP